jgi:hypothetical protein
LTHKGHELPGKDNPVASGLGEEGLFHYIEWGPTRTA